MRVSDVGIKLNIPFQRKLKSEEKTDYKNNAITPALDYLGTKEVAIIMHGACFPSSDFDIGVGSPYGKSATEIIPLEKLHGFNSTQLGPVGVIRDSAHISPYKSTVSTRNYLFLDLSELTKDKYANILSDKDINFISDKNYDTSKNYSYSDFPEAFANYDYCIKIANKNFKEKLSQGNENAILLNEEFNDFKKQKGKSIYQESLFNILSKIYSTPKFAQWSEFDRNLISELNKNNPDAIMRYKKIVSRSQDDFDSYIFGQFLIEKQIKENTQIRKSLDFKYINDFLVGFSYSDEWAHQDLFLKGYRVGCPNGGSHGPQLWNIPVLNPDKLFNSDGTLGDSGLYLKKKLDDALNNFDNIRIDHALGLIDPYIYNVDEKGNVDWNNFYGNNISKMGDLDKNGNYQKILEKIILPTLKDHGIDKSSPIWEDLCTDTDVFNRVYHGENNLPGITQLEWMQGEKFQNTQNWGLVGSHDSDPAVKMIKKDWVKNGDAWNIFYLAGLLNANPKRSNYRDEFCKKIANDDMERVKAKFAELFLTCKKVQISFVDFFGIDKTYNVGGSSNPDNWKLRLGKNYEDDYYKNLSSKNPTALNIPEILKIAVQAKADMNNVSGEDVKNIQVPEILENLDKYEKILKEPE